MIYGVSSGTAEDEVGGIEVDGEIEEELPEEKNEGSELDDDDGVGKDDIDELKYWALAKAADIKEVASKRAETILLVDDCLNYCMMKKRRVQDELWWKVGDIQGFIYNLKNGLTHPSNLGSKSTTNNRPTTR